MNLKTRSVILLDILLGPGRHSVFVTQHRKLYIFECVLTLQILHSIFFLGKINDPQHPPESIVTDAEMLENLKNTYPRPFDHYSSQLPKRSPFSCVLDMVR